MTDMTYCFGCMKEKNSVKPSKLTGKMLCGSCRMNEYSEMKGQAEVDRSIEEHYRDSSINWGLR